MLDDSNTWSRDLDIKLVRCPHLRGVAPLPSWWPDRWPQPQCYLMSRQLRQEFHTEQHPLNLKRLPSSSRGHLFSFLCMRLYFDDNCSLMTISLASWQMCNGPGEAIITRAILMWPCVITANNAQWCHQECGVNLVSCILVYILHIILQINIILLHWYLPQWQTLFKEVVNMLCWAH